MYPKPFRIAFTALCLTSLVVTATSVDISKHESPKSLEASASSFSASASSSEATMDELGEKAITALGSALMNAVENDLSHMIKHAYASTENMRKSRSGSKDLSKTKGIFLQKTSFGFKSILKTILRIIKKKIIPLVLTIIAGFLEPIEENIGKSLRNVKNMAVRDPLARVVNALLNTLEKRVGNDIDDKVILAGNVSDGDSTVGAEVDEAEGLDDFDF